MTTGIPRSQATRNARIAAKPRCGFTWPNPEYDCCKGCGEWHSHHCAKFRNHAGKDHVCACGSTKSKPRKPLDVRG